MNQSTKVYDKDVFTEIRRAEIAEQMTEEERILACNPLRSIRNKCKECRGGNTDDVGCCDIYNCPLWDFRFGTNPYKAEKNFTDEEIENAKEKLGL